MSRIRGSTILITGGASGLGRLLGLRMLEAGAAQLLIDQLLAVGADIGSPMDMQVLTGQSGQMRTSIQHHHQIVDVVGNRLGQLPAGGDQDVFADTVQRYLVTCSQGLDAADAGNHLPIKASGSSMEARQYPDRSAGHAA